MSFTFVVRRSLRWRPFWSRRCLLQPANHPRPTNSSARIQPLAALGSSFIQFTQRWTFLLFSSLLFSSLLFSSLLFSLSLLFSSLLFSSLLFFLITSILKSSQLNGLNGGETFRLVDNKSLYATAIKWVSTVFIKNDTMCLIRWLLSRLKHRVPAIGYCVFEKRTKLLGECL